MEYMTEERFDVSLLFGIKDNYPKWGYATTISDQRMTLRVEDVLRTRSDLKTRVMRKADLPAVISIYERSNDLRTGSIVRSPLPDMAFAMGTEFGTRVKVLVACDKRDRVLGYVSFDIRRRAWEDEGEPIVAQMRVSEIGLSDARAADALLERLAREARKIGADTIQAWLPADHEFADYAKSFGATVEIVSSADSAAMMRIIDLRSLMGKLEPEFARRLEGRRMKLSLGFATDLGDVTVTVGPRSVRVAEGVGKADAVFRLEQWKLLQLIMGYRSLRQVLADPRGAAFRPQEGIATEMVRLPAEVEAGAEALFPRQNAFCWHTDWF